MQRSIAKILCAIIALTSASLISAQSIPTFDVRGSTFLAFFTPVTKAELSKEPGANEALDDFQFYAGSVSQTLAKSNIEFKEVYARGFKIKTAGKTTTFTPSKIKVGYYLVEPGKEPHIEYGVNTDDDLLKVAGKCFGLQLKTKSQ